VGVVAAASGLAGVVALGLVPPAAAGTAAAGPTVVTVAGTGRPGTSGRGGPATAARLDGPTGIAVDGAGDLFIADTAACQVVEVPATAGTRYGVAMQAHHLYAVAGTGCGSPTRTGSVGYPTGVAVDAAGQVFVADATGDRVLELHPSGDRGLGPSARAALVSVAAGTGHPGTAGLGGPATGAQLDSPTGVATDAAGDLFIADTEACRLDEVPTTAGTRYGVAMQARHLYSVAGTGICGTAGLGGPAAQAELYLPAAVAVDATGDLLVGNRGAGQVVEVAAAAGSHYGVTLGAGDLGVVAGTGIYAPYLVDGLPARGTTAELNFPYGVAVAPDGDLYVADTAGRAVREVPAADGTAFGTAVTADDLYTLVGGVPTGTGDTQTRWVTARVTTPYGVAVDAAGDVFYSDRGGDVVREVRS
jgi:sugar lactone lactonase YvrE